jgi:hypothetical protein
VIWFDLISLLALAFAPSLPWISSMNKCELIASSAENGWSKENSHFSCWDPRRR